MLTWLHMHGGKKVTFLLRRMGMQEKRVRFLRKLQIWVLESVFSLCRGREWFNRGGNAVIKRGGIDEKIYGPTKSYDFPPAIVR